MVLTGNGESGFDSGEGALKTTSTSDRCINQTEKLSVALGHIIAVWEDGFDERNDLI